MHLNGLCVIHDAFLQKLKQQKCHENNCFHFIHSPYSPKFWAEEKRNSYLQKGELLRTSYTQEMGVSGWESNFWRVQGHESHEASPEFRSGRVERRVVQRRYH